MTVDDDRDLVADIEESEAELDEDEPIQWVRAHKQVVFSAIDYNLEQIADQAISGDFDLQPQYQRRLRWTPDRKSRLIESFLMNVPIPPIYLSEEPDGRYAVIDGKQRITAIAEFLNGDLALTGLWYYTHLEGKRIGDLDKKERDFLTKRIALRAVIILEQSPSEIKLQTYRRLNTGGVHLNAQEIRNIAFRGPLNDLIMELSEKPRFHRLLHIRDRTKSTMYQHMRDAELVLRFLAFRESWRAFEGSVKGHMDSYMERNRNADAETLESLRQAFQQALDVVEAAFGDHAFQRWQPDKRRWRRPVVAALYDAEMIGSIGFDPDQLAAKQDDIIAGLQKLFTTKRFREATEAATNAKSALTYRIDAIHKLLRQVTR